MKYWSLLVLAGCNKLLDIAEVPAAPDAPADSARFSCAQPVLADDFAGPTPCLPWATLSTSGTVAPSEGPMMLVFKLSNMGEAKCETSTGVAIPSGGLTVQAAQVPAGTGSYMSLASAALDLEIYEQAGSLIFSHSGGTPLFGKVQYNATQMQFWRIDPLPTMTANASYSPDGITWTLFATGSFTPPTIPVDVKIKAGAFDVGEPTDATFQHLLACP